MCENALKPVYNIGPTTKSISFAICANPKPFVRVSLGQTELEVKAVVPRKVKCRHTYAIMLRSLSTKSCGGQIDVVAAVGGRSLKMSAVVDMQCKLINKRHFGPWACLE